MAFSAILVAEQRTTAFAPRSVVLLDQRHAQLVALVVVAANQPVGQT
jgi:hypothetical protein